MSKQEFLAALRARLSGMPQEDIDQSVDYYREMIDDRMEEGLTEEQAVEALGAVDEIAAQILRNNVQPTPPKAKRRNWKPWMTILLVLGSPVWASLLFAAVMVVFSIFVALWSLIVALYAVVVSLAATGVAGLVGALMLALDGHGMHGLFALGAGLTCGGLTVLLCLAAVEVTGGIMFVSKKIWRGVKGRLARRRAAQ